MSDIMKSLPAKLQGTLTKAELKIIGLVHTGKEADFRVGDPSIDNLENASEWDGTRTIRAEFLFWLCTDRLAIEQIHCKGVRIIGARIDGQLDFDGATLPHHLHLIYCWIPYEIIMVDAQVRTLVFSGCLMNSLLADRLNATGSIIIKDAHIIGKVRLIGASLGNSLNCNGATIKNPQDYSIICDGVTTNGSIWLAAVRSKGTISLMGADIGSDFYCTGQISQGKQNICLIADDISVRKGVRFNEAFKQTLSAQGEVRIVGGKIAGDLVCEGASFESEHSVALRLERTSISGVFVLTKLKSFKGILDLIDLKTARFVDDETSWPDKGKLLIEGFEYESIGGDRSRQTAKESIKWLRLQADRPFQPQPYEQLARVFRLMGRRSYAVKVLIAKEDAHRKFDDLRFTARILKRIWRFVNDYGYRPWKILFYAFMLMIIALPVFYFASSLDIMQPAHSNIRTQTDWCEHKRLPYGYPPFNPLQYSVDLMLPFVDLEQARTWDLNMTTPSGEPLLVQPWRSCFAFFYWFYRIMSWIFPSYVVILLSGMRRES